MTINTARKQKAISDFLSVVLNVNALQVRNLSRENEYAHFRTSGTKFDLCCNMCVTKLRQTTTWNFQGRTMTWTSFWEGTSYTYYTDNLVIAKSHSWFSLRNSRTEHTVELLRPVLRKYDAYVMKYWCYLTWLNRDVRTGKPVSEAVSSISHHQV